MKPQAWVFLSPRPLSLPEGPKGVQANRISQNKTTKDGDQRDE